jgi:hypothetical protein
MPHIIDVDRSAIPVSRILEMIADRVEMMRKLPDKVTPEVTEQWHRYTVEVGVLRELLKKGS